ncbi:hypothetical protein TNCV_2031091 [Trichonephila clavipes]|nr:hypothetical protein TNCV_2031091 [Trichonephila clavipes]
MERGVIRQVAPRILRPRVPTAPSSPFRTWETRIIDRRRKRDDRELNESSGSSFDSQIQKCAVSWKLSKLRTHLFKISTKKPNCRFHIKPLIINTFVLMCTSEREKKITEEF